jgi:phosphatidylserine/phosphatidylglycerophosphate/cardiolipin synthase-like enzyme
LKPEFVDNRKGNTLKAALAGHLEHRLASGQPLTEVCIASAYFNPAGFAQVAAQLERVPNVRLMLGAEPSPEAGLVKRKPADPQEPEFSQRRLRTGIHQLDLALRAERDSMAFSIASSDALKALVKFLRSGRIDVRRYEKAFLHAKAYLFSGEEAGFLAGSSNFTRAGLTSNLELNLGRYAHPVVGEAKQWFEDLWQEAAPYDLAAIYEEMFKQWRPWDVYLRILWELYGDEVQEAREVEGKIPLTNFQKHGVWRAQTILEKFGGVIVADEVGLGKTFIGGDGAAR